MTSSDPTPVIPANLQADIEKLRQLNTQNIQAAWQQSRNELTIDALTTKEDPSQWESAPLNEREHIAWEKGRHILWLYQALTVPTHLHGYPLSGLILRIALTWWADDAQIYVDGKLVQSGDLFECFTRICLHSSVTPGQTFHIAIRLVSPGHDNGALVRSQLIYELPAQLPTPEPSFVADELTVLATLEPASQPQIQSAIAQLDWQSLTNTPSSENPPASDIADALNLWQGLSNQSLPAAATIHPFQQSLSQLRRTLQPLSSKIKQHNIQCVGHAHLDMAWLWPIPDTWNAAERTFTSVLNLQKDFSELTYTHSSPALFEWIEHNRPELFKEIQRKVAEGSWSIDAGLWIEPEFNIISGEAIVRHILYGQRYCKEKFGHISKVAWLPDSFGFCWQLPQLLTQGGIETFATLKLSWNDTTEFPHQLFWWQSPDGSQILSLMLPPIGTDIDPVKMSTHAAKWENNTHIPNTLWLPGMGDHGGGPTRDMLEKAQRWQTSPFFPALSFTNPKDYVTEIVEQAPLSKSSESDNTLKTHTPETHKDLPIWTDELYLELHRGCYTSHADQKQSNRHCEDLLYQAEVFATVAQLTAQQPYPKADLEKAWKTLLFNQFHDILPGTSIPDVFVEANHGWDQVKKIGQQVLKASLSAICNTIPFPDPPHPDAQPIIVFNSLSWSRDSVITIPIPEASPGILSFDWAIYDTNQQLINCQTHFSVRGEQACCDVSFLAKNLPAVGYQCFWLCPSDSHTTPQPSETYTLENQFLQATIDPHTGHISSLIEKTTQTETFRGPGNQLQAFQDQGQYWDAWNIDPDYANHPLPAPTLKSIRWFETGPLRQRIRTTYTFQKSTITHYYTLEAGSPFLKVETYIQWQETQVLLKANFPLTVSSDTATYEIPFGAITRTTQPKTAAEKAKWEVPAIRWADLSDKTFGTSILTNCKHGFDTSHNHLRLTLLKSPIWPDPESDQGNHHFTYAIYPHQGNWQSANTARHARELNIKPIIHRPTELNQEKSQTGKTKRSFVHIHNPNLILTAFKPSEDHADEFILRCYETQGKEATLKISHTLSIDNFDKAQSVNLLESSTKQGSCTSISPWKVSSYRLTKTKQPK